MPSSYKISESNNKLKTQISKKEWYKITVLMMKYSNTVTENEIPFKNT